MKIIICSIIIPLIVAFALTILGTNYSFSLLYVPGKIGEVFLNEILFWLTDDQYFQIDNAPFCLNTIFYFIVTSPLIIGFLAILQDFKLNHKFK
jgi:hypothetical protein